MHILVLTIIGVTIWLIFIITGAYSFYKRSPKLLLPMDEDGNFCGYGSLKKYDKLYLYKITENNVIGNRVCVSSCPKNFTGYMKSFPVKKNLRGELEKKYFYASKECKLFYF